MNPDTLPITPPAGQPGAPSPSVAAQPAAPAPSAPEAAEATAAPADLRFRKAERLRYKSLVGPLFEKGASMFEYPLRLVYRPLTEAELAKAFRIGVPADIAPLQVMVTVPKKKRRRAVDRVLMRRRIREAWRLQRHALLDAVAAHPELRTLSIGLIYAADVNLPYDRIAAKLAKLLAKLARVVNNE